MTGVTGEARSGTPAEVLSREAERAFWRWWPTREEANSRSLAATWGKSSNRRADEVVVVVGMLMVVMEVVGMFYLWTRLFTQ